MCCKWGLSSHYFIISGPRYVSRPNNKCANCLNIWIKVCWKIIKNYSPQFARSSPQTKTVLTSVNTAKICFFPANFWTITQWRQPSTAKDAYKMALQAATCRLYIASAMGRRSRIAFFPTNSIKYWMKWF